MGNTDTPSLAPLPRKSIADGLALVAEAGWNQVEADWQLVIEHGRTIGCQDGEGKFIASGWALPYGDGIGWVSMVLVNGAWRRKGIATRIVADCAHWLEDRGIMPVLDATPAGAAVYRPMGFEKIAGLTRWRRQTGTPTHASSALVRDATLDDLPSIALADRRIFGADRGFLLADLLERPGAVTTVATEPQTGFALSRKGRVATQIGPVSAENATVALALLEGMLARIEGPVLIDAFDRHSSLADRLEALGFTRERPFERMARGNRNFGLAECSFAAAGPELG